MHTFWQWQQARLAFFFFSFVDWGWEASLSLSGSVGVADMALRLRLMSLFGGRFLTEAAVVEGEGESEAFLDVEEAGVGSLAGPPLRPLADVRPLTWEWELPLEGVGRSGTCSSSIDRRGRRL